MSVILLPDKWRRQPNGPVLVNLAHPLARKISYAIVAGVDLLNPSLSQLTFAENNIYGRVFRGSSPHKVSADTAESTVIGHHYYDGDNNDYAALSWGFYVSASNNSQLGIGMGPITGSSIYAVNRANSAGSTELEPSITIPYSAIWAITGTLGSGAAAKAYKNGVYFADVAQSGSGTFSQSTSRTFDSYLSSSSGKASAWNYKFNRILSPEEIRELSNAPYQILVKTPRILYFTAPSGGGATITGSGTPTSQASTVSGTAERSVTGSGTPTAQASTVSGAGTVGGAFTGSGTLQAQSSTVSGTAERSETGAGTPASQAATVSGVAERVVTGTGTPTSQASTVSGTGQVGNVVTGSGTPTAQAATVAGTAERTVTASGALSAQSSTVAGTAERTITGSGALSAQSSTVYGFDSVPVVPDTGGGGSRTVAFSSRKLRQELGEWEQKNQEKERLKRLMREDEELVLIMLALAA